MDQGKACLPSNLSTSVSDLLTLVYSLPAQLGPTRMGTVRVRSAQVLQTLTCSTMAICRDVSGPVPQFEPDGMSGFPPPEAGAIGPLIPCGATSSTFRLTISQPRNRDMRLPITPVDRQVGNRSQEGGNLPSFNLRAV
jgi:hypothetical protein